MGQMRRFAWSLVVLVIAGCAGEPADSPAQTMSESDRQAVWIEEMKRRVRQDLRDPSSAEFRNVRFSRAGGVPAVCGEVNGSNAFGGKAGFQRFVAAGDIRVLEEEVEDGGMVTIWSQICGD